MCLGLKQQRKNVIWNVRSGTYFLLSLVYNFVNKLIDLNNSSPKLLVLACWQIVEDGRSELAQLLLFLQLHNAPHSLSEYSADSSLRK